MNDSTFSTIAKGRCLLLYKCSQDGEECVRLLKVADGGNMEYVWGGWVPGINLEEKVKREVVESFAVQLGEGDACEEPTERNSMGCSGAAPSSILFLHSLLLTVPSLLGSNSRKERASLLSYPVNVFWECHAILLIKENINMPVMTTSEILFVHTYHILYCESNCLRLVQFQLQWKHYWSAF